MRKTLLMFVAMSLAVTLAKAQDVEIYRVVPSKILYRQGEDATANVVVKNHAAAPRQAKLGRRKTWRWPGTSARKCGAAGSRPN